MTPEQKELETLRAQLQSATVRVPYEVQNGSIQLTRAWLKTQKAAIKTLKKKTASPSELRAAMNCLLASGKATGEK